MTWLLTVTGCRVDMAMVDPGEISILSIAHALALLNRFHGHTERPYSVAEHSLLVVEIMERELGEHAPAALLAGLLHDAHEAHVGDMAAPLKHAMRAVALADGRPSSDFDRFERLHSDAVLQRFGIARHAQRHADAIHHADMLARATELRDLMPALDAGGAADLAHLPPPVPWVRLSERAGLDWQDWRQAFIDRYQALRFGARQELEP